ncbi:MAG: hypothetical protein CFE36_09650 [Sphingomonadaceae bacterium PASS1]|nr:MAG: hypothetical protein CFE36_09650 [Sphingomonadaceae bacterium PASS1]
MQIFRNSILNLVGSIVPILVSIVTLPLYIEVLGIERYGLMALAWIVLGYFGFLDLGMGRAVAQRVASLSAVDQSRSSAATSAGIVLSAAFGFLGGIVILLAFYLFRSIQPLGASVLTEEALLLPVWLAIAMPAVIVTPTIHGALQGHKQFKIINLSSVLSTCLFQIIPLIVAIFEKPDLRVVIPAAVAVRVISLLAVTIVAWNRILPNGFTRPNRLEYKSLLIFGGWTAVSAIISPLMVTLDRLLIGAVAGPKVVAFYTVPWQLAERTTMLATSIGSAVFPSFAQMSPAAVDLLAKRYLLYLLAISTPTMIAAILFLEPALGIWISAEFADQSAPIGQVLLFGFWLNALAVIPFTRLQALGHARLIAICHLIEVIPYVALLWLLLQNWGGIGAAIAFTLRVFVDLVILSFAAKMGAVTSRAVLAPFLLMACSLLGVLSSGTSMPLTFIGTGALVLASGYSYWLLRSARLSLRSSVVESLAT